MADRPRASPINSTGENQEQPLDYSRCMLAGVHRTKVRREQMTAILNDIREMAPFAIIFLLVLAVVGLGQLVKEAKAIRAMLEHYARTRT